MLFLLLNRHIMRSRFSALILIVVLFSACKKDTKPTVIEVTVQSSSQAALRNESVNLSSDQHVLVTNGTSGSDGKIDFSATPNKTYYLYHVSGDGLTIITSGATYITIGTFTSQDQINSSPNQGSSTKVGDPIYLDVNG